MAHILVVEDDPMNMELMVDLLESYGYEVTSAKDGFEAFARANDTKIDLILLNSQLPGMRGIELLQILKSNPESAGIPVVALTEHDITGDNTRFIKAGCLGYISKPIDIDQFYLKIAMYLSEFWGHHEFH